MVCCSGGQVRDGLGGGTFVVLTGAGVVLGGTHLVRVTVSVRQWRPLCLVVVVTIVVCSSGGQVTAGLGGGTFVVLTGAGGVGLGPQEVMTIVSVRQL